MRNNGSVHIIMKYLCCTVAVIWGALIEVTTEMPLECWALIGHLSEWQLNRLSNKDALVNNDNNKQFVIFSNGGARNSPKCKVYYKRTEGLPTDGKGGRKREKYFLRRDVITLVKARGSERGNAMKITTS